MFVWRIVVASKQYLLKVMHYCYWTLITCLSNTACTVSPPNGSCPSATRNTSAFSWTQAEQKESPRFTYLVEWRISFEIARQFAMSSRRAMFAKLFLFGRFFSCYWSSYSLVVHENNLLFRLQILKLCSCFSTQSQIIVLGISPNVHRIFPYNKTN